MVWTPLRTRQEYKDFVQQLDEAITNYYESGCEMADCHNLCLVSYRFLSYIHSEICGLDRIIAKEFIPAVTDAIMEHYGNTSESWQNEVDALEIMSRAAYRAIADNKKEHLLVG